MTIIKTISMPIELAEAIPHITEHDRVSFSGFVQKQIKKRARELEGKEGKRRVK